MPSLPPSPLHNARAVYTHRVFNKLREFGNWLGLSEIFGLEFRFILHTDIYYC